MNEDLYNEFKSAEAAERAALIAWADANYALPRNDVEWSRLSDLHDAAYARYRSALSALAAVTIPLRTQDCAHCGKVHVKSAMKALDTNYTAEKAGYSWGIERDALLCADCIDELEEAYGRYADDGCDAAFENATDR